MNRIITLLIVLTVFASCSDDIIKTNSPSMQGETNYGYFHALNAEAVVEDDGRLKMRSDDRINTLEFYLESLQARKRYPFGINDQNTALYKLGDSITYSTGTVGDGELYIDEVEEGEISGTFYFSARRDGDVLGDTLSMSNGVFFKVELVDYLDEGDEADDEDSEEPEKEDD